MAKKIFFLLLVGLLAGSTAATAQDSTAPISGAPGTINNMNMAGLPIVNMSMPGVVGTGDAANKPYVDQRDQALYSQLSAKIAALESRLASTPTTSGATPLGYPPGGWYGWRTTSVVDDHGCTKPPTVTSHTVQLINPFTASPSCPKGFTPRLVIDSKIPSEITDNGCGYTLPPAEYTPIALKVWHCY